jgi:hypothetical protein
MSVSLAATFAHADEPLGVWSAGDSKGVKTANLAVPLEESEFYTDRYTAEAWFKDGTRVWVSFLISNLGPGTHKLTVRSRWYEAGGKEHYFKKDLERSDYTISNEPFKFSAAGHTLSGTPRSFSVKGSSEGYTYDLDFKSGLAPWRPGSGRTSFGADGTQWLDTTIVQPKAVVTGSVSGPGGKKTLDGYGYVLHTIATVPPYEMAKRFVEVRAMDDGDTVVWVKQFTTPEKYGGKNFGYLYVAKGDEVLVSAGKFNLKFEKLQTDDKHANKYKIPFVISTSGKRKEKEIAVKIEGTKIVGREDGLEKRNAIEATLVRQYAQPVDYTIDGSVSVTITEPGKEPVISTQKASYGVSHLNK